MNIEVSLDRILAERGQSFYWLAKATGISYTTLWRLKSGQALGINFATLEKICAALDCVPGDVLQIGHDDSKKAKATSEKVVSRN